MIQFWIQQFVYMLISNKKIFKKIMSLKGIIEKRKMEERKLINYYMSFTPCSSVSKLKKIWKPHHQYLKFMRVLPNKRKKKDDVFFSCHVCLPKKESNGKAKDLK